MKRILLVLSLVAIVFVSACSSAAERVSDTYVTPAITGLRHHMRNELEDDDLFVDVTKIDWMCIAFDQNEWNPNEDDFDTVLNVTCTYYMVFNVRDTETERHAMIIINHRSDRYVIDDQTGARIFMSLDRVTTLYDDLETFEEARELMLVTNYDTIVEDQIEDVDRYAEYTDVDVAKGEFTERQIETFLAASDAEEAVGDDE